METSIDPWLISLLSAILGGTFTLIGQLFSFYLQKKSKLIQEQSELKSLLMSFHVEIETLYERYIDSVGHELNQTTFPDGITFRMHAHQDYMVVFSANAHRVGQIKDNSLRKAILQTYIITKSLLDSYETNNSALDQLRLLEIEFLSQPELAKKMLQEQRQAIRNYGPSLYDLHRRYCQKVHAVTLMIKQHIMPGLSV